ncbi:TlpA disulfide reductase family protein [Actinophytocola oryzae]|uniref:Thiol-disulfide isomerase/thioredoxin n=1 Tax=Actinophytocola oryzae TaxID=502181 RepID=A0A4R7VDC2_9PSEU|nr:TlpA disulfide reductase family protein [Actinophytocola oryzae]TDV46988.1 thiol-disulfide isomerase/thioredoxin [Actinophytocola oryzae]
MRKLALLLALVFVAGCSTGKDAVETGTEFNFVSPGGKTDITYDGGDRQKIAPLEGESLLEEGRQLKVSDYKGKVVVLNLWGAWCPPCRVEAPQLQKVWSEYRDKDVQVLGIDVRDDDRSFPQDFVRDTGLTYPSIYDPGMRSLLALQGYPRAAVPSTIVLDKEHRVAAVYLRDLLATDLTPLLDRLVDEK